MSEYKIGERIGNQFEVLKILGSKKTSQRGVVYLCHNTEDNEIVVLKSLQGKFFSSESISSCFHREALTWVHLESHPHVVRAKYVIDIEDRQFLILEYVAPDGADKNTLSHHLREQLPLEKALKWSIQFCYGMEYAISRGVSPHRDIKPDNIMITSDGNVKITDFGMAKFFEDVKLLEDWEIMSTEEIAEDGSFEAPKCEDTGGSAPWMAPEQFNDEFGIRSDIYSYGIVLFQMVNQGEIPFDPEYYADFKSVHRNTPVPTLKSKLFPIIQKCLEKKPEDRYEDFTDLRGDLEKLYLEETGNQPPSLLEKVDIKIKDHYYKGLSFFTLKYYDEAIVKLKEALEINPNYTKAKKVLGLAYFGKGQLDNAIKELNAVLKIKPDTIETHTYLGQIFEAKGQNSEALKEYNQTLQINPNYYKGLNNLGRVYEAIGDIDNAIVNYQKFIDIAPKYEKEKIKKNKKELKRLKKIRKKS